VLDGQVGDAAPGVEDVRRHERGGRAGVEARRAGAAAVGQALIEGQLGGREDDADEEEGAERRREEVGVLADPAQARASGEIALEDRARVDGGTARDVGARGFAIEYLAVEREVKSFASVEEGLAAAVGLQEKWRADGRWFKYVKFLEDGGRTLTHAHLVVKARKA